MPRNAVRNTNPDRVASARRRQEQLNQLQQTEGVRQLLSKVAQKALHDSGKEWDPRTDIVVRIDNGKPISITTIGFKQICVGVNVAGLAEWIGERSQAGPQTNPAEKPGKAISSAVKQWCGHYSYCPLDSWRHERLCEAAAKGGYGSIWVSESKWKLATATAAFFEKNIVDRILTREKGRDFAEGLVLEHLINKRPMALLSTLFFRAQCLVTPEIWENLLREYGIIVSDPLTEALWPEVLHLLFGVRTRMVRGRHPILRIPQDIPSHWEWRERVRKLAQLLIPYLEEESLNPPNPAPSPGPQPSPPPGPSVGPPDGPTEGSQPPIVEGNPFVPPDGPGENTRPQPQPGGQMPGTSTPPPRIYNYDMLDRYYTEQAKDLKVEGATEESSPAKKPDLLTVGFLDSEPASPRALVSGQIDWFRTRAKISAGRTNLQLYKRTEPLEIPLGGEEPAGVGVPHLLLLVDSSGSMVFTPPPNAGGKYDIVLRSCYGVFRHIQEKGLHDRVQLACINFSGRSIESGWHSFDAVDNVKRVLLTYQRGGTILSPAAIRHAFETRPGRFLAIAVTDGCIGNVPAVVTELKRIVEADCDLALLHVGRPNAFTEAIRALHCPVHIVNNANDLIGLTLQIANDKYRH